MSADDSTHPQEQMRYRVEQHVVVNGYPQLADEWIEALLLDRLHNQNVLSLGEHTRAIWIAFPFAVILASFWAHVDNKFFCDKCCKAPCLETGDIRHPWEPFL